MKMTLRREILLTSVASIIVGIAVGYFLADKQRGLD